MPQYAVQFRRITTKKGVTSYRNSLIFQMERQAGLEPVTLSLGNSALFQTNCLIINEL